MKIHFLLALSCLHVLAAKSGVVTNQTTGKEYATLQQAVDDSSPSQTVIVGDGTWQENLIVGQDDLTLRSENGPATCILDGGGDCLISWTGTGGRIEGFTLTNGATTEEGGGGVLKVDSLQAPDLIGNVISGNITQGPLISDCISLISGNVFRDNSAHALIRNRLPGETIFENNVMTGNTISSFPPHGQLVEVHAHLVMRNSTIFANDLPPSAGVAYFSEGRFFNSIFWDNGGRGFHLHPTLVQNCIVESTRFNDPPNEGFELESPPDFTGNSNEDPLLNSDGIPLPDSPVLQAGNAENAPATDFLGVKRGSESVSIGAYENPEMQ